MKPGLLICLLATLLTACGPAAAPGGSPTFTDSASVEPTTRTAVRTPASTPEPTASAQTPPRDSGTKPVLLAARVPRAQPGSKAKTATLADGLNGFAFELYRAAVKGKDDNLIYSPYSIGMAFSMVYAGARGKTEAQMRDVLGFLPQEHHLAANGLERHLASLGDAAPPTGQGQAEAFRLKDANAVWGQRGFPFLDAYLRTLAEHYGAGVRAVDFQSNPEGGRKRVNDWVADQTEGNIRDIVPPGVISPQTRLVLANAIYFKAAWLLPFEKEATKARPFTLLDGDRVTVPMMTQDVEPVPFAKGDDYQAVVLPYTGNTVDMVVIVPDAGRFDAVENHLSAGFLKNVRAASERGRATITMPRFDFASDLPLTDLLPGMGMPDAFQPGAADFGGIARDSDLYISAALHRATIKVNEQGTEATAATVIAMDESAAAEPPPHLTIDRPFIFAITERETGAILFLGRVMNPAK